MKLHRKIEDHLTETELNQPGWEFRGQGSSKTLSFVDDFSDDGLPCVTFNYKGKQFTVWWTSSRTAGMMEVADESPKAAAFLKPIIDACEALLADPSLADPDGEGPGQTDLGYVDFAEAENLEEAENKTGKYTFTISPPNRAAFTRTSDDRTFDEAQATAKMFEESFPGARVKIDRRKS